MVEKDIAEDVVAIEVPDDTLATPFQADWPLLASVPNLDVLEDAGTLVISYRPNERHRFRDLFRVTDIAEKPKRWQFAYYLAREAAHDIFSVRRQDGPRDWVRFATSVGSVSVAASQLITALSQLF